MSSFLFYSKEKRSIIQAKHPTMKNTEVSRILGEMWSNATEQERRPHIEREILEREKYKVALEEFKLEEQARKRGEEEKRKQVEDEATQLAATNCFKQQQIAMSPILPSFGSYSNQQEFNRSVHDFADQQVRYLPPAPNAPLRSLEPSHYQRNTRPQFSPHSCQSLFMNDNPFHENFNAAFFDRDHSFASDL
jgi:hypothetical protein